MNIPTPDATITTALRARLLAMARRPGRVGG
jgi:hypothetical protein